MDGDNDQNNIRKRKQNDKDDKKIKSQKQNENCIVVEIVKSYKINTEKTSHSKKLSKDAKLDKVRKELMKSKHSDDVRLMGSNCRFLKDKESNYDLLEIVDDKHTLYIIQKNEFDLTKLMFEKGLMIKDDGSITSAPEQAFEIINDKIIIKKICSYEDKVHECKHETTAECKRSRIFDGKLSTWSEWCPAFLNLNLSYEIQKNTNHETKTKHSYKISKLRRVSEKYGHFYARHLILGGAAIKNEKYTKSSETDGTQFNGTFSVHVNKNKYIDAQASNDTKHNSNDCFINNREVIIGGNSPDDNDKNKWRKSLTDEATWGIIGYDEIRSLFELLDESLQKDVLNVFGHQILKAKIEEIEFNLGSKKTQVYELSSRINEIKNISKCIILASIVSENENVFSLHVDHMNNDQDRPVIVIHHIQENDPILTKLTRLMLNKEIIKIKLCWVIIGSPTSFNFITQYPLALKSKKYTVESHKTDKCGKFGTCVLEPTDTSNIIQGSTNNTNTGDSTNPTHHKILYNPNESAYAIGNYFSSYQESAYLFIYDIRNREKVTDESVLRRLALYNWQVKYYLISSFIIHDRCQKFCVV
ncbi:24113_t:CDS:2 [Gigaspora margarita]|uniref:24113_t:CDS:1 n=1 Tax=Gigaspora margarita TaxID=4874 RepID=A0ABN7UB78_GIGMA|nr:24113_t:CDS:2 [Gigaspora margarita]